ncbi:MAG: SGNH/GDSL hydrolase family protein [Bacteroidota bacterium]
MNPATPKNFVNYVKAATEQMKDAYVQDDAQRAETRGFESRTREMSEVQLYDLIHQTQDLVDLSPQFIADTLGVDISLVLNKAEADEGIIGFLNEFARQARERKYHQKTTHDPDILKIVSEGDSWFQFPIYVKDIIDWINKEKSMSVYSLGAGGDWIYNILHQREYVKALQKANNPQFFLISGGGNDLLQDARIKELCHPYDAEFEKNPTKYIKDTLGDLISVFEFLYIHLYCDLEQRYPDMKILCHGYDYAYPTDAIGLHPIKGLLRWFGGNGQWLKKPFVEHLGIKNPSTQHTIVKLVIDRINEMHQRLSETFENVYYIDLRGLAPNPEDWHDEIHPSSENFKLMADKYIGKIKALTDLQL